MASAAASDVLATLTERERAARAIGLGVALGAILFALARANR
jgi:hypothetical protein